MAITEPNLMCNINENEHYMSNVLFRKPPVRRELFDPENLEHLRSYESFLKTGRWGEVHFFCEHPHVTVPETVSRKFALHEIAKKLKAS